jgi:hypothetical protein
MGKKLTAHNVRTERRIKDVLDPRVPPGNKAVDLALFSDIHVDGEKHHEYNEPSIGFPADGDIAAHVQRHISNHLRVWHHAMNLPEKHDLGKMEISPDPPADEIGALRDRANAGRNELMMMKIDSDLGLLDNAEASMAAKRREVRQLIADHRKAVAAKQGG